MDTASSAAFDHLRSAPRDSMFLAASINRPGGDAVAVKVRNLSSGGMMADCLGSFAHGERIEIMLRGVGAVSGRIAWAGSNGRVGVCFDRAIDPKLARKPVTNGPVVMAPRIATSMKRPGFR